MTATSEFLFVMHHVGARGGTCGFEPPTVFHADSVNVLYEPDTDCLDQIEERTSASKLKNFILPYALGETSERRTFNFHLDPYANSFRLFNSAYGGYSMFAQDHDYLYGESVSPVRHAELEVRTVDGLVCDQVRPMPAPDFMLVDTEGTAYEVLAGARKALQTDVLAVSVELEVVEMWQGERLFGEVCKLLDEFGLELVTFHPFSYNSPHRVPAGLRGKGFTTGADALFMRRTESLATMAPDINRRWIKTCKLACIALWLGYVEYGLKALAQADAMSPGAAVRAAAASVSYMQFLDKIRTTAAQIPARYPPTFGERYSTSEIQSRFAPTYAITVSGTKARIKAKLLAYPALLSLVRLVRRNLRSTTAAVRGVPARARRLLEPRYTAFERVFVEHGLAEIAEIVRARRLVESPFAR